MIESYEEERFTTSLHAHILKELGLQFVRECFYSGTKLIFSWTTHKDPHLNEYKIKKNAIFEVA